MVLCCLCNFFKRTFLYQILIIIAIIKFQDIFLYHEDFYDRIERMLKEFHLKKLVKYLPDDMEIPHKGFLATIIVFASFSMLNVKFFQFWSAISCLLLAFIYNNPFTKIKTIRRRGETYDWVPFLKEVFDKQFVLYICLAFAMLGHAFKPCQCTVDTKKIEEKNVGNGAEKNQKTQKNQANVNKGKNTKKKKE